MTQFLTLRELTLLEIFDDFRSRLVSDFCCWMVTSLRKLDGAVAARGN
ncbi:MAG: hypothetical protein AAFY20_19020 [Cyanobacteria bacterium J06639_14]